MKIFVGMSGGVDSSVAAALLTEQGHEVTGVFIKVWQPDFMPCTATEDRHDALRVAAHLGIPFLTYDLEAEYKKRVVEYMLAEYRAGRTPNPDIMCNTFVKFGAFLDRAIREGADAVATGHYAVRAGEGPYELHTSADAEKDQTYFLSMLSQNQLAKSFFPVGGYRKEEVRSLARKFGLPTAEKKDSQGLCFLGAVDMQEFLARFIPEKEGAVEREDGTVVGTHKGQWFYTIGQRHGFSITAPSTSREPLYILRKDAARNVLVVAERTPENASATRIALEGFNWIVDALPEGARAEARIRYRQKLFPVRIGPNESLIPDSPIEAPPPGQIAALYTDGVCRGGGIIAA